MTALSDPAASLPEFATREQVARHLQVSLSTVDRLRRRGALPAQKFGTLVRFNIRHLIAGYGEGEIL